VVGNSVTEYHLAKLISFLCTESGGKVVLPSDVDLNHVWYFTRDGNVVKYVTLSVSKRLVRATCNGEEFKFTKKEVVRLARKLMPKNKYLTYEVLKDFTTQ